jgi:hypothetical protein
MKNVRNPVSNFHQINRQRNDLLKISGFETSLASDQTAVGEWLSRSTFQALSQHSIDFVTADGRRFHFEADGFATVSRSDQGRCF